MEKIRSPVLALVYSEQRDSFPISSTPSPAATHFGSMHRGVSSPWRTGSSTTAENAFTGRDKRPPIRAQAAPRGQHEEGTSLHVEGKGRIRPWTLWQERGAAAGVVCQECHWLATLHCAGRDTTSPWGTPENRCCGP